MDIQNKLIEFVRERYNYGIDMLNKAQESYAQRNFMAGYVEAVRSINEYYKYLVAQYCEEICKENYNNEENN